MNRFPYLILATMSALLLVAVALAATPTTPIGIETDPKDAEVLVDGVVKIKDTPASMIAVTVAPGTHTVDIRKPGMQSQRRTVAIGEGVTEKGKFHRTQKVVNSFSQLLPRLFISVHVSPHSEHFAQCQELLSGL